MNDLGKTPPKKSMPASRWSTPYYLKWCFTVKDFAQAFDLPEGRIRQAIRAGELDPTAVHGVADFAVLQTRRRTGKFQFTYADLARATGCALTTVRSSLRIRQNDVNEVATFVQRSRLMQSTKLTELQVHEAFEHDPIRIEKWAKRWPKFDLYHCGDLNCSTPLLEAGLCSRHGGSLRPAAMIHDNHFVVRIGSDYIPICHLILGVATPDFAVRHVDDNSWNNRPDNLEPRDGMIRARRAQWSYGYRELAELFGLSEDGVRIDVSRRKFDPKSLSSINIHWSNRNEKILKLASRASLRFQPA